MPRNEEVLPSLRPRSLPPLIWTTGGFRLGPDDEAGDGAALGFACSKASPVTPATTPPRRAVVVPSIWRRFIRPSGACDVSLAMLPPEATQAKRIHLMLVPRMADDAFPCAETIAGCNAVRVHLYDRPSSPDVACGARPRR